MSRNSTSSSADRQKSRLHGRRLGRPLNAARKDVLETLLPELQISVSDETIAPASLFPAPKNEYWLEIGFGNGEHLAALMERHPDRGYIGVEPFINGMAAFLKSIRDKPHDNVRVLMDDALPLVAALADESLSGIYILNPDPWPKKRHHKRRIVRRETLDEYARVLKPGGSLVMTTDVDDLAEWMVTQASNHPAFDWTAEKADDWRTPPADWVATRYENKGAAAGRLQTYLLFSRK